MTPEDRAGKQKAHRRSIIVRTLTVLLLLMFAQIAITYCAFQLINRLPSSWTGLIDDMDVEASAHRGTVYLIQQQIAASPDDRSVQEILHKLQPHFGFPLSYMPAGAPPPDRIIKQFKKRSIVYDDDDDEIFAPLAGGGFLKLGPLLMPDILNANASATVTLLTLWLVVSVLVSFVIIYCHHLPGIRYIMARSANNQQYCPYAGRRRSCRAGSKAAQHAAENDRPCYQ